VSAHIFGFGRTKKLQAERKQRHDEERVATMLRDLDQAQLERCLAGIVDDKMRRECFEAWKPCLTFEPAADTLEKAYELQVAALTPKSDARPTLVTCDDCSRVAGIPLQHPAGHCPPGGVIAAASVRHLQSGEEGPLRLLPPGMTEADVHMPSAGPHNED
jgi:hypothetical protein